MSLERFNEIKELDETTKKTRQFLEKPVELMKGFIKSGVKKLIDLDVG